MIQRYSFIPIFFCLLLGLAWWSKQVKLEPGIQNRASEISNTNNSEARRLELLETFDRIVAYEHYYHSVYGHYTKLLNRIGFKISSFLTDYYDIRVIEASADRLLITAFSEDNGRMQDVISIDHDYQVHANFDLPLPRVDFVKTRAMKYMRLLSEAPAGQSIAEAGIFRGYFRYSIVTDSKGNRVAIANGVLPPVFGLRLELKQGQDEVMGNWQSFVQTDVHTGQNEADNVTTDDGISLERETYLAQKIFHGEMGRYAKTWSELSRIAHFKFEGKDQYWNEDEVPFRELNAGLDAGNESVMNSASASAQEPYEAAQEASGRTEGKVSEVNRQITSATSTVPLEIEPISEPIPIKEKGVVPF